MSLDQGQGYINGVNIYTRRFVGEKSLTHNDSRSFAGVTSTARLDHSSAAETDSQPPDAAHSLLECRPPNLVAHIFLPVTTRADESFCVLAPGPASPQGCGPKTPNTD